ncbi:hypothetical protein BDI4_320080 [Burkholderia diffusa]|nr:hypothetical protein BDI4_320080 [Burkholderia diffusa]
MSERSIIITACKQCKCCYNAGTHTQSIKSVHY